MKVTIEEINGVPHTVVWFHEKCDFIAQSDNMQKLQTGEVIVSDLAFEHIATALPPLPRNPKAEDAPLLHLYAAHGLYPSCTFEDGEVTVWAGHIKGRKHIDKSMCEWQQPVIDYATDKDGNRIDIALRD